MKLLILGDGHITNTNPVGRTDNYFSTVKDKLANVAEIYHHEGCDALIETGDLVDSPHVSYEVISLLIDIVRNHGLKVFGVVGQHDIFGHSLNTIKRSPMSVLQSSNTVTLLGAEGTQIYMQIRAYGASFGEPIPVPTGSDSFSILVIHKMIGDRQLYPGQELEEPRAFLRQNAAYDLIICGDYHYRFIDSIGGRFIVNPGAMLRKTRSEWDLKHEPAVIIFDTITRTCKTVLLNFKPVETVFDLTETKKHDNEALMRFVAALKANTNVQIDWKEVLLKVATERHASDAVKLAIDHCMEETQLEKSLPKVGEISWT